MLLLTGLRTGRGPVPCGVQWMGAFFQSVAIPTDSPGDVRTLVTTWLAAKGFEPRPEPPLFECDAETERGLCLFASDRWVVLLYSHMDTEARAFSTSWASSTGPCCVFGSTTATSGDTTS